MQKTLAYTLLFLFCGAAAQGAEIRLKSEAECTGPIVRLADIAEIDVLAPAEGSPLADVALFPAPAAGKERILRLPELRQLLKLCDVDLTDCQLAGAEAVVIRAAATQERVIVRPALHLIPSKSSVRHLPKDLPEKSAAAAMADELPPLVTRGGAVTVRSLAAGVRITTSGKALADGKHGATVPIELADGRQRILAEVVAPQIVEVRSAGAAASAGPVTR